MRHQTRFRFPAMFLLAVFCAMTLCLPVSGADNDRHIALYGGVESSTRLIGIFSFDIDPVETGIATLAVGKRIWTNEKNLRLEVEFQFSKFFGSHVYECRCEACINEYRGEDQNYSAEQEHEEFNAALVLKWTKFPWDKHINTCIGFGEGISYATEVPASEQSYHHLNHDLDYPTSKTLNYLMLDIGFSLPKFPDYALFYRIHHRSGVYGLINDVKGGSNFVGFGVRRRF